MKVLPCDERMQIDFVLRSMAAADDDFSIDSSVLYLLDESLGCLGFEMSDNGFEQSSSQSPEHQEDVFESNLFEHKLSKM